MNQGTSFNIPVLMYHRIAPNVDSPFCVDPTTFAEQMQYAAEHFKIITAKEAGELFQKGEAAEEAALVITFDDGYLDFYEHAFPVLQKHAINVTQYLPTDHIGKDNLWNPKDNYICNHLTWDEIRELADAGVDFGAHSCTHQSLVKFTRAQIEREVIKSTEEIEGHLGQRPASFSYPYGVYNKLVREVVASHFDLAFSVINGFNDWNVDPLAINRIYVGKDFCWDEIRKTKHNQS